MSYLIKSKTEIFASLRSAARYPAYLSEISTKDTIKFLGVQFSQYSVFSILNNLY